MTFLLIYEKTNLQTFLEQVLQEISMLIPIMKKQRGAGKILK